MVVASILAIVKTVLVAVRWTGFVCARGIMWERGASWGVLGLGVRRGGATATELASLMGEVGRLLARVLRVIGGWIAESSARVAGGEPVMRKGDATARMGGEGLVVI